MELTLIIIAACLLAVFIPLWYFGRTEFKTDYQLYKEIASRRNFNWREFGSISKELLAWKGKQYCIPAETLSRVAYMIGTADSELCWFFDVDQKLLGMGFATYGTNGTAQFISAGAGTFQELEG